MVTWDCQRKPPAKALGSLHPQTAGSSPANSKHYNPNLTQHILMEGKGD